jgi:predicted transcriptional regulator
MLKSYWDQILEKHRYVDMPLHKVFIVAKIPTSTYYRTVNGRSEISYETAKKVYQTLDRLSKRWPTGLVTPKKINGAVSKLHKSNRSN